MRDGRTLDELVQALHDRVIAAALVSDATDPALLALALRARQLELGPGADDVGVPRNDVVVINLHVGYPDRMTAVDPIQRVNVIGTSGTGKTTVARAIAERIGAPYVELDALHWGPNWTDAEPEAFRADLRAVTSGDAWVVDGNFRGHARDIVWPRVQVVVWIDFPFWLVMWQVVSRTLHGVTTKHEMWAGNTESLRMMFSRDSIVWWAASTFHRRRRTTEAATLDPANAHVTFVRLTSRRAVRRWLASLAWSVLRLHLPRPQLCMGDVALDRTIDRL